MRKDSIAATRGYLKNGRHADAPNLPAHISSGVHPPPAKQTEKIKSIKYLPRQRVDQHGYWQTLQFRQQQSAAPNTSAGKCPNYGLRAQKQQRKLR
jgi:hypothetical protein